MTKKTKKLCEGCKDDFYNKNIEGGCWLYKNAKIVKRTKVGTWQQPPYTWEPQDVLNCHWQKGSAWIKKNDPGLEENYGRNRATL